VPYQQHTVGETMILVRSTLEMASLTQEVRAAVTEIDPDISVIGIQSMPKLIAGSYEQTRYRALLVAAFGGFAILLTAIGLYGVTVRSVARRTREVGIRVALGSSAARVQTLLMKETFAGVVIGAAIGLPAAWVFALRIAPYLFGIQPADARSFGAVTGVLAGVAAMASFLPARRATRISPAAALRND
jgi:putative ABC transport system permease protein